MRLRSALGILKAGSEPPDQFIEFVCPSTFDTIKKSAWNEGKDFYTLLPTHESGESVSDAAVEDDLAAWIRKCKKEDSLNTADAAENIDDPKARKKEEVLGHLRRYVLVVTQKDGPPSTAYVSAYSSSLHMWCYIDGGDDISKRNFALLGQFLTIQAVATSPPPITYALPAGGR